MTEPALWCSGSELLVTCWCCLVFSRYQSVNRPKYYNFYYKLDFIVKLHCYFTTGKAPESNPHRASCVSHHVCEIST